MLEDKHDVTAEEGTLSRLSKLAALRSSDLIDRVLSTAREQLGMEIAFVSEYVEGRIVFRSLQGDAKSFEFEEGLGTPLEELGSNANAQFCPRTTEALLSVIDRSKVSVKVGRSEELRPTAWAPGAKEACGATGYREVERPAAAGFCGKEEGDK